MTDGPSGRMAAALATVAPDLSLRSAVDADADGLLALVGAAYDEFACGPMDPGGFDADLTAPGTHAAATDRRWWVVTDGPDVVASVAHGPPHAEDDGLTIELARLYLAPAARGRGIAGALVRAVGGEARLLGASTLAAWSDTRLVDAHHRYLRLGFADSGARRELHDPAGTTEVRFVAPVATLLTASR